MLDDAKNSKYINELQEIGKGQCEEAKEIKFLLDVISDIIDQLLHGTAIHRRKQECYP